MNNVDLTSHEASWPTADPVAVTAAAEPAPRVRLERQPAILIALLFSACLLLDLAMAAAWPDAFVASYLSLGTAYVILGIRNSQVLLALTWLCLSTHGLVWRAAICLGVIIGWDSLLAWHLRVDSFFIIHDLASTFPVLVWRLLGARIRHTGRTFPGTLTDSELGRWQFRLSTLVGCLLLAGPMAYIAKYQSPLVIVFYLWPYYLSAVSIGLGVVVAVATVLGEGKWRSVAPGIPLAYLIPVTTSILRNGALINIEFVILATTSLLLMLLVLRAAGYRLQWRPPWR